MISFEQFLLEDGSPIYIQIIKFIKRGIVAGIINSQDEMPSRRVLSALLGVNPNTIQKAYRMLEEESIIESRSGAKSYVTVNQALTEKIRVQLMEGDAKRLADAMKQMGVSKEEALSLAERVWELEGEGE